MKKSTQVEDGECDKHKIAVIALKGFQVLACALLATDKTATTADDISSMREKRVKSIKYLNLN